MLLIGIVNFLSGRKQRVVDDGVIIKFVEIDKGVPQGTVLGPVSFSIMVNDINVVNPDTNLLIKYADDITLSVSIGPNLPWWLISQWKFIELNFGQESREIKPN